ncbi:MULTISPECIES: hypothetical protein [unclassified Caballeronia]|uniref:hypothetical protein n=1 Tax=unclassified Caballeronia TaxID=2646786 RepID=UPI00286766E3|nr:MULTISPECIES: hypothetical protein [unclassified Caballeronia]MDR5751135.1 hypothetical protein [Caballeronia sp. LZ024]MDR5844728.1 hypothetical protein [Caballeronia sp. LZ031]
MNRDGNTNLFSAPVDSFAPKFKHRLNSKDGEDTVIDAMTNALKNPAFEQKWGDVLRAKHPQLATKHANQQASNKLNGHTARAADSTSYAADSAVSATVTGELAGTFAVNVPKAHMTASRKTRQVSMDGWTPRGFEQTPYDQAGTAVALGEQQRQGDPLVAAGMAANVTAEALRNQLQTVEDNMNESTGGKGVNSRAFAEGKTEKPRDIAPLVVDLAKATARMIAGIARNGGIRRVPPTVVGLQGVKGLRGMDESTRRKHVADAKVSDAAYTEAHAAMLAGTGAEYVSLPVAWDSNLQMYRPVRGE